MCDYSLEMYRRRPAFAGESVKSTKFKSGSVGFAPEGIGGGDEPVAVCMRPGTVLQLDGLPENIQDQTGEGPSAQVTFTEVAYGRYHDGVRFRSGLELALQQLGPDVTAEVVSVPGRAEDRPDNLVDADADLVDA